MVALNPIAGDYINLTRPIVDVWKGLLNRAKDAKQEFTNRSDQVMSFYSGGAKNGMWSTGYMERFMGGAQAVAPPRFKITLNVAFELVAIFGPLLFWEMCNRKVSPHRSMNLDPSVLAGNNPELQQYFSQLSEQQATEDARNDLRAKVLEHMLNYFQREQPEGGLAQHSDLAIFEALTKGAGFLKTEDYQFPFSDRTLVGSFFQSVDDVLVDADCTDPLWTSADWIAIRHRTRSDKTEEHFGLPPGSLRPYATISSQNAAYQSGVERDAKIVVEKDVVEWYEIFSRAGFGNKLTGKENPPIPQEFDRARGSVNIGGREMPDDFVYLCICTKCNYPLNLPSREMVKDYATEEWVKAQTDWPTEYWRDNKWPVEMLWFHPHSGKTAWPEPPLAPALGELTCLNILMSAYVQEAFEGRQMIIGYEKNAVEKLQSLLDSGVSPLAVEIDPQFGPGKSIQDVISFMKRPEINNDLPKTIEFVLGLIEKRTGLRDEMYGGNSGANPRSATEFQGKMDTVNIRPEHMQKKVAAWQSRVADKEVFCAYIHVAASDIQEQLGPLGVAAWEELVTNEAPEAILRGAKAIVEASGIRRPNKTKDMADLQGMQQFLMPILAGYMAQSNDPGPINGFLKALGDAGEFDVQDFLFPTPPPNEVNDQMQQAELQKVQAEADKLTADAEKSRTDSQLAIHEVQNGQQNAERDAMLKAQVAEHGAMIKQQTAEHTMSLKEKQAQLAAAAKQQEMLNSADVHEQSIAQKMEEARQKLAMKLFETHQNLQHSAATHLQQTAIADKQASDDARRGNLITYQKMLGSAAEHAQRMSQARQLGSEQ